MLSELVKSVRIVPELHTKTPGNEDVDIVEIELDGEVMKGKSEWFHFMDHLRFRCDRRSTKFVLNALGLDEPARPALPSIAPPDVVATQAAKQVSPPKSV